MVYGVQGVDKVIKPGKGRALIDGYLEKKARGEIKPSATDANGNIIPPEPTRRFTIKDIGLHSEPHIG